MKIYYFEHAIPNASVMIRTEPQKDPSSCLSAALHASVSKAAYALMPLYSSETVSFFRPLARRAANTLRPFAVAILSRKPCLFFLFLLEGWNVLFICVSRF